ncbi:hypothetical protein RLEG12_00465 (plasmid) [Rhizobium leguminosarum bv. trifolii CB782]|nr:hypothetical protein RLEG12_00465 [Rhizobium leguminosarum bv. trifolii CB782]
MTQIEIENHKIDRLTREHTIQLPTITDCGRPKGVQIKIFDNEMPHSGVVINDKNMFQPRTFQFRVELERPATVWQSVPRSWVALGQVYEVIRKSSH